MSGTANAARTVQFGAATRLRRAFLWAGLLAMPWAIAARGEPAGPVPETDRATVDVAEIRTEEPGGQEMAQVPAIEPGFTLDAASLAAHAGRLEDSAIVWYHATPPGDRVSWGGLAVCCLLGLSILFERSIRLLERRIIPGDFTAKFLDRLHGGKLDAGRALDYCEENPSPAARVALAAVRRWGRPATDLERAVALAHRVESDRLRRHVGTLRRVAALAPLVGFLGTLFAAGRTLAAIPPGVAVVDVVGTELAWGPELASALAPLTAGIVIATLAIVAYDGLMARIERLAGALDRLGAETIDAIAMSVPMAPASLSVPTSRSVDPGIGNPAPSFRMHAPSDPAPTGIFGLVRPPHPSPSAQARPADRRPHRLSKPRSEGNASAQG